MNRAPALNRKNRNHETTNKPNKDMKTNIMKTTKSICAVAALLMAAMVPSQAQTTNAAEPQVLRDGDGAKKIRVEGLHKVRFAEIFLAERDAKTGKIVAACYNTSLTPDPVPGSKDTATLD